MLEKILQQAGQAASRQDWAAAEEILSEAASGPEAPPVVWFQLGKVLFVQRKLDAAAAWFRKAAEGAPDIPDAWLELGRALAAADKHDQALAPLRQAAELAPQNAQAHRFAANVARSLGDFAAAAQHFKALRALEPQDGDAWMGGYTTALEARDPEAEDLREQLMADPQARGHCLQLTVRCSKGRIPLR